MYTLKEKALIYWKWILSFGTREWDISHYPVRVRANGQSSEPGTAFVAHILNWPGPIGLGETRGKAFERLRDDLEEIRKHRDQMPRPGTHVPIEFSSTARVDSNVPLLGDFISRVLGFSRNDPVFISDESSLYDFGDEAKVQELTRTIRDTYAVDVSDIVKGSGNIADILERITEQSSSHLRQTGGFTALSNSYQFRVVCAYPAHHIRDHENQFPQLTLPH
jgi:hypothetical protein